MRITFLGAVGTVTGSKYLVEAGGRRLLVDCGLFQGYKQLRLRNWDPPPVDPATIDTVVLTHAHVDHSGYLPVLIRNGFAGRVLCTGATRDLCGILLPDCGYLFERDAEFANRHGFSKHKPALPLFTQAEGEAAIRAFAPLAFETAHDLGGGLSLRFLPAGHILGSAFVRLESGGLSLLFSGDLGRPHSPTMPDPAIVADADYLIVESTYGNRKHDPDDPEDMLAKIIARTAGRGGVVLIPAFAVGRTQVLLYHLHRLKLAGRIPDVPIFIDSPMAIDAAEVFRSHPRDHRLSAAECRAMCATAKEVRGVEESKALDRNGMPKIVISASGMATGGRVLHHLKVFAPDPRNTILFAGFQAGGTRGADLVAGARSIKIHGGYVPVRAEVDCLHMLSAHADTDEIMGWLCHFAAPPKCTFVTTANRLPPTPCAIVSKRSWAGAAGFPITRTRRSSPDPVRRARYSGTSQAMRQPAPGARASTAERNGRVASRDSFSLQGGLTIRSPQPVNFSGSPVSSTQSSAQSTRRIPDWRIDPWNAATARMSFSGYQRA
jgi:metallo-beta-lactamase family protein